MGGDDTIAAMDEQLNEQTILVFRRLAHAKVPMPQTSITQALTVSLLGLDGG